MRPGHLAACLACTAFGCPSGDDGGDGDPAPFVPSTAFPPAGAALVVGVIGDFGDTSDLAEGETDTFRVARLIESWSPDFIATVGDNDYSDKEFAGTFRGLELGVGQYFHEWIGNYQGSAGPGADENRFFPIPGDHDYGDDCDAPHLDDYLAYFTLPVGEIGETWYDVRRGALHAFFIDSVVDCHQDGGATFARERAWLERTATASDAPFKVVLVHHPPYSSGARHGSAAHTQWPYGDWGIDLVIAGDDHVYERLEKDGVTYLVNGLGGVERHEFGTPLAASRFRYRDDFGAVGLAVVGGRLEGAFLAATGALVDRFTIAAGGPRDWYRPAAATTWQWQLQGTLNTTYDVALYDVDLFETPRATLAALRAAGRKVICYFSAGSYEDFRDDAGAFDPADLGAPLEGFADERWVDVRSPAIRAIVQTRLDAAVAQGCDGVEPDNVDGYVNATGFALTAADQLDFNRFLAREAHLRGLAVGLKNDLDQVPDLVAEFDFALNEQCHEFDECDRLQPFVVADKPVFVAEYDARWVDDAAAREVLCTSSRRAGLHTLVLPVELDDTFRWSCDP
jgi:endo-alpha-1,4-polygalactosaminidase (GH114 family)